MMQARKRYNLMLLLILLIPLLSACFRAESSNPVQETESRTEAPAESSSLVQETESRTEATAESTAVQKPRILLIYMVGSDLESEYGSATKDINELLSAPVTDPNFRVYLCTGGTSFWWRSDIPADACTVFEAAGGSLTPCGSLAGANMAEPDTLTWFIDTVHDDPETAELSLIFWNHGGGATAGCGADANFDFDIMTVPEIRTGLASAGYIRNGGKFSLIGFDACLMGMLEVADSLKDIGLYMTASEETMSGSGWDYSFISEPGGTGANGGGEMGKAIAEAYRKAEENEGPYKPLYTISVLDLTKTGDVTESLDRLSGALRKSFTTETYSEFSRIRQKARSFGNKGTVYDSMDLTDFAGSVRRFCPDEAESLTSALSDFTILNLTNIENSGGVAVYFPYLNKETADSRLLAYSELGFCPEYTGLITDFTSVLNGKQLAKWNIETTVPLRTGRTLSVSLNPSQTENFASADLMVWEDLKEDGEYRCWYMGGEAVLSKDGVLTAEYENTRFVIQDGNGENIAPCTVIETERNDTSVTYKVMFSVIRTPDITEPENPTQEEALKYSLTAVLWEFYLVDLFFTVDDAHPDGVINSMYITKSSKVGSENFLPPKYDFTVKEGDIVQCLTPCRRVTYDENGNVRPFSEWEDSGTYRGFDFTASGDGIRIGRIEYEPDVDYCGVFRIADTQQNTYMSDLVPLELNIDH